MCQKYAAAIAQLFNPARLATRAPSSGQKYGKAPSYEWGMFNGVTAVDYLGMIPISLPPK